MERELRCKPEM